MQDKVQEIMGLFDAAIKRAESYQSSDIFRQEIESKLRELVREPLTLPEIESATGAKQGTPMFLVAESFVRATEKVHNIVNVTKE